MSYRLTVGADGKVRGNAKIEYNDPFPTVNGAYGSGAMMGVVMHTMVCDLPVCIEIFNNPSAQVSAHFGIAQDGTIHQFGPIGKGWVAWAEMAGNYTWYSIEHADHGDPSNLLTDAQILASAQLVECLSAFAGFPLQVSNHTDVKGYGIHQMGGVAWGDHSCPQANWSVPLDQGRAGQRAGIIKLAKEIRLGTYGQRTVEVITSDGTKSLLDYCQAHGDSPLRVIARTMLHGPHPRLAAYAIAHPGFRARLPKGVRLYVTV